MYSVSPKSETPIEILRKALKNIYTAFIKHDHKYLQELKTLNKQLNIMCQKKDSLFPPVFQHIFNDINNLADTINIKIQEGVLFSDKAIFEMRELFEGMDELMRHMQDLLLTQNPILAQYILRKTTEYKDKMRCFTTEHEERLIKGICLPRSSTLYLNLMEAFKDLATRMETIVKECKGNMS
ncbi:MAG: hypothetical protein PWP65_1034 [Clostridia bacterium]|nr:hypothetical protein [Clostridia bacterium]